MHMMETISKYKQVLKRLSQDLGREPLPGGSGGGNEFGGGKNPSHSKNRSTNVRFLLRCR